MNYNLQQKEIISNIIGLNPTGTLSFKGTFSMDGANKIVNTPANISKENAKKTDENEFICNNNTIENFESYNKQMQNKKQIQSKKQNYYNLINKQEYISNYIYLSILFFILVSIFFIVYGSNI